jgi:DNA-binding LacI/PurR family transcriptional regulator
MAFGALRSLRNHGLQPGRDVSVIGFDDHDMSDLLELTTIAQPVQELGVVSAQLLLDQLENPGVAQTARLLPTRLIVRGSTRAPAGTGRD